MSYDLVVVKEFRDEISAHLAKANLDATGVECLLVRGSLPGELRSDWEYDWRILARPEDAEEASRILQEIAGDPGEG